MINTPEQFAQFNKSTLDTFQAAALASMQGFEKLAELNIQAARASIDESTVAFKNLLETKDAKALADLSNAGFQPAADKFASYAQQVFEITSATNNEIARIFEKQFAEANRQFYAVVESVAANAPAGSEGMANMVKQAVSTANSAFDQVSKATKQVVEVSEANFAAAAKSATAARLPRQAA
jgi:phasin family protein